MATHNLTSASLVGTIDTRLVADGDDILCVVDLAPRTLGTRTAAHPMAMVRGTVTFAMSYNGECKAIEHTLEVSNGAHLTSPTMVSITDDLQPYAADALAAQAEQPSAIAPIANRIDSPMATILPLARRAFA